MSTNKQIAIIGAGTGPAGLINGSILEKAGFTITLYEQRGCLGGTWAIQPLSRLIDIRSGLAGIYSASYPSLRSNVLRQTMALPDFPFPDDFPGYQPDPVFKQALPGVGLSGDKSNLAPLYLNLFHPTHPELAVTGMILASAPFILYHCQAEVIAGVLAGRIKLPDAKQRQFAAEQAELRSSGRVDFSVRRKISLAQIEHLARLAGIRSPTEEVAAALAFSSRQRMEHPDDYQDQPFDSDCRSV